MKLSVVLLPEVFTRDRITEHQRDVVWETTNKSSFGFFFPYLSVGYFFTFLAFHFMSLILTYCPNVHHTGSERPVTGLDLMVNVPIYITIDANVLN